jgi:NAD(P)-dependent dehydrogenase (short-subunit alcohol dehydrogenase family)
MLSSAAGAKVVLGDVKALEPAPADNNFAFVNTEVTQYDSVVNLFSTAFATHGRIDHAISNAGIVEVGQLFATGDSDDAIKEPPSTAVLDVNLKGTVFVARVAVHYLRSSLAQNTSSQKDASILLVSSVAGFGNWPGLFQYSASKHGVMGLFHSTKDFLFGTEGIRVNVVLPNMTGMSNNPKDLTVVEQVLIYADTQMVTGVIARLPNKQVKSSRRVGLT